MAKKSKQSLRKFLRNLNSGLRKCPSKLKFTQYILVRIIYHRKKNQTSGFGHLKYNCCISQYDFHIELLQQTKNYITMA